MWIPRNVFPPLFIFPSHPYRGAKEALVVTNRPLATNELFEVEIGGCNKFKGVKNEMKSVLKGKELIRIGVTAHW